MLFHCTWLPLPRSSVVQEYSWSPDAEQGISIRFPMNPFCVWGRGPHHCTFSLSSPCDIPASGGQIQLSFLSFCSYSSHHRQSTATATVMSEACAPALGGGGVDGGGGGGGRYERKSRRVWCCSLLSLMMSCSHHWEARRGGRCESASSTHGTLLCF